MRVHPLRIAFQLMGLWWRISQPVNLGVRIALVQDGKLLLVRHTYMWGWHFPGGLMNRHETPLEAAAREASEEAGAELLEPPTLVDIVTTYNAGRSDHVAVYLCRSFRLKRATDRWEIAERKLFALDALPPEFAELWHKLLRKMQAEGQL